MRFLAASLIMSALAVAVIPAQAETLQQAMASAYNTNPTLQAERAKLRAVDEQVALAKSGQRPTIDANADIGRTYTDLNGFDKSLTNRQVGVGVTQPLYRGGSIEAGIQSAEKNVLAARASLTSAEQTLFLSVAQVYFNMVRDEAVLRLTKKTEEVLKRELQAASDRLKVGEATRTDQSQAEARYAGATADRIQAEGNVAVSRAAYEKVVGHPPAAVKYELVDMEMPPTLDNALERAHANNPQVIAAQYSMQAAEHDVDVASGALLPQLDLQAGASRGWDQSVAALGEGDSAQVMARLTIPLYRGGADYAKTRAAKETASQRRVEVRSTMDEVRENAVRAWQQLGTARASINARKKQVESAKLAFEGVKQESDVGTRTVLDRLNAEAETLQAQVDLVQAERDQAVAMFDVKAAVGELTAEKIGLPVEIYNATAHYNAVRDKWIGTGGEPTPPASPAEAPQPAK